MLEIHVCQECLCRNAHVLIIEYVPTSIVPEHVYAIAVLFILDFKPSEPRNALRHLSLRNAHHYKPT